MSWDHSPAPWRSAGRGGDWVVVLSSEGVLVATVNDAECEMENASLLTAAPELLLELMATRDAMNEVDSILARAGSPAASVARAILRERICRAGVVIRKAKEGAP